MNTEELLREINSSENFACLRNSGILPEPDADDGFYFISYSHADYKRVLPDVIALRGAGLKIWYDRGLESGKSWIGEVRKKISSYYCKGVIVYYSENYLKSQSCILELQHIMRENKQCLNVFLDEAYRGFCLEGRQEEEFSEYLQSFPCTEGDSSAAEKERLLKSLPAPALYIFSFEESKASRSCMVAKLLDKNLQTAVIPKYAYQDGKKYRVRGISSGAFENCDMLEEVVLPDGWGVISNNAFVNCHSLRTLKLGKPFLFLIVRAGYLISPFVHCENLKEIVCPKGVKILRGTYAHCDGLTEMIVPQNFWATGGCFTDCVNLKKIKMHKRCSIGRGMFDGCVSLTEAEYPLGTFADEVCVSAFRGCASLEKFRIPQRVKKISENAFQNCTSLREITIPKRVKEIAFTAFAGCYALACVTLHCGFSPFTEHKIDELFSSAELVYTKKRVPSGAFGGEFLQRQSDRKGYFLYVRG